MSDVRPGLVLADSRHESEANAYLQRRLALFYAVTLAAAIAFYLVGLVLMARHQGWGMHLVLYPRVHANGSGGTTTPQ